MVELITIKTKEGYNSNDLSLLLNNEEKTNFWLVSVLWVHEAIKHIYNLVYIKLNTFEPKSRSEILEMVKAIKIIIEFLNNHNTLEETVIWVWLKEELNEQNKTTIDLSLLDKQHNDFKEIENELNQLLNIVNENLELQNNSSPGWLDILKKLQKNINSQIEFIYQHFYDEELIIVPLVTSISKKKQEKINLEIRKVMQEDSCSKFSLSAIFDASKINKNLDDSLSSVFPWAVRKVILPLAIKNSYKWFSDFTEIKK